MAKYATNDIRNVGLVGHQGSGKTSLAEAFLFDSKATTRLGSVANETSTLDYEPEEVKRKSSISSAFASCEWKKKKVTIIDTPGDSNFFADTRNCMTAMDAAIVVVSAVDGVQVQTDRAWTYAKDLGLPRAVFISKLDRERADFDAALAGVKKSLDDDVVALQIPIGKEDKFSGMIDLLALEAYRYKLDGSGDFVAEPVPSDLEGAVKKARESLVDAVAATDDALTEKYLDQGDLTAEELGTGLASAILAGKLFPAFCGSATRNVGAQPILDFIASNFPSPAARAARKGVDLKGAATERAPDPAAPFGGQVFKTIVDQFAGKISVFRVWSGTLKADSGFLNTSRETSERFGQILVLNGKTSSAATEAGPGDIVAVAKLKNTFTGDSIAEEKSPVRFEPLPVATPVISFAIRPKAKGDEDKIANALGRIVEEDPTIQISRDAEAKEVLISGMGQLHVEITVEKIRRKFGVEVELAPPRIPYRETIKGRSMGVEGKHKKQTGGRGQFGVCYIDIEPGTRGSGFEFVDNIVGGAIPRQFIPSVEKGIKNAMSRGIVSGYPVVDVRVTLNDGKYHDVDSSDMAFQMAGSKGFKRGFRAAKPILLEPLMSLEVSCPDDTMGDVIGDINQRRGRVLGMDSKGREQIIKATVPMSELLKYAPDLRSITGGRGSFSMEFSHYEELPGPLAEKVMAEFKAEEEDED
ncbi:MAG: elongation factor G [Deltaproteobacteria bacterium]|nr:elongation factor G [Deltaproteobacteria bacterium]